MPGMYTYAPTIADVVDWLALHATPVGLHLTDGGMPLGTPRERPILAPHKRPIGLGFSQDQEYYRTRTQDHLYEPWQVDLALFEMEARAQDGALNYDCHACGSTVLVSAEASRCPTCHATIA